jgi:hypothetical protein
VAADEVSIYNLALDAVGTRNSVSATTEESREAEVCRLWFGPVRDLVLRAAPWTCAKAFARLALLKERDDTLEWAIDDPEPGFRYAYAGPSDMIRPRYLSSFQRFTMGIYGEQRAVMTQVQSAILVYTKRQATIPLWDSDLYMAVTKALAAAIAMPLHGKRQRASEAAAEANAMILQARVSDANSEENQFDTVPEWIAARGSAYNNPLSRFYYPYGPLISLTELGGVS